MANKDNNNKLLKIIVAIFFLFITINSSKLKSYDLTYIENKNLHEHKNENINIKKPKPILENNVLKTQNYNSNLITSNKIVGGIIADKNDFPFIVSLQTKMIDNRNFQHYCGGSIISDEWVLTAAHCVENGYLKKGRILAGIYNLKYDTDSEILIPTKIIIHPKRNQEKRDYDFALIKLNKKVSYPYVELDNIPHITQKEGTIYTVAGWGATKENGKISDVLMKVKVPYVKKDICQKAYKDYENKSEFDEDFEITKSMICAGYKEGGKDSCRADSGGPLIYSDEKSKKNYLVGVVSWGIGCARPELYGVYGKVSEIVDWIKETIDKN